MPDNQFEIKIATTATGDGAEKTVADLKKVESQAKQTGDSVEEAYRKTMSAGPRGLEGYPGFGGAAGQAAEAEAGAAGGVADIAPLLAAAVAPGVLIYQTLTGIQEESLKINEASAKETDHLMEQVKLWREMAAVAKDSGDVLAIGDRAVASLDHFMEKLQQAQSQELTLMQKLEDWYTSGWGDAGTQNQQKKIDSPKEEAARLVQLTVSAGNAMINEAQRVVDEREEILKRASDVETGLLTDTIEHEKAARSKIDRSTPADLIAYQGISKDLERHKQLLEEISRIQERTVEAARRKADQDERAAAANEKSWRTQEQEQMAAFKRAQEQEKLEDHKLLAFNDRMERQSAAEEARHQKAMANLQAEATFAETPDERHDRLRQGGKIDAHAKHVQGKSYEAQSAEDEFRNANANGPSQRAEVPQYESQLRTNAPAGSEELKAAAAALQAAATGMQTAFASIGALNEDTLNELRILTGIFRK